MSRLALSALAARPLLALRRRCRRHSAQRALPGHRPRRHAGRGAGLGHRRAPRLQGPAAGRRHRSPRGRQVWEGKCASCHGVFGESNEVFSPLVGGTTADDIETGRVAQPDDAGLPRPHHADEGAHRLDAVGLHQPRDAVERAEVAERRRGLRGHRLPAATWAASCRTTSCSRDRNIAEVQQRLPNRNGMTTDARACGRARELRRRRPGPTCRRTACMSDCAVEPTVASLLARRTRATRMATWPSRTALVGAQRGVDTHAAGAAAAAPAAPRRGAAPREPAMPAGLLQKNSCTACHAADRKLVGPSLARSRRSMPARPTYLAAQDPGGRRRRLGQRSRCRRRIAAERCQAHRRLAGSGRTVTRQRTPGCPDAAGSN